MLVNDRRHKALISFAIAAVTAFAALGCQDCDCSCGSGGTCGDTDILEIPHRSNYSEFRSEYVTSQDGFGVYQEVETSAIVTLSYGEQEEYTEGNALDIEYDVNTWASIRREFKKARSFCGCDGIQLEAMALDRSTASTLRFTIADVMCKDDAKDHGSDELWWSDEDPTFPVGEWTTFQFPFDSFRESAGFGTRHNNAELDLKCVAAVEISIVNGGEGHLLIRNVRTYAD